MSLAELLPKLRSLSRQEKLQIIQELAVDLAQDLSENSQESGDSRPIWEVAQEITQGMSEEEINQLPTDGAEQHDHYIYGTPKRHT